MRMKDKGDNEKRAIIHIIGEKKISTKIQNKQKKTIERFESLN